jgi:hypothetical protein
MPPAFHDGNTIFMPRDFFNGLLGPKTKKADVAEHPEVFDHVGLLINEPLGMAGLLFI